MFYFRIKCQILRKYINIISKLLIEKGQYYTLYIIMLKRVKNEVTPRITSVKLIFNLDTDHTLLH